MLQGRLIPRSGPIAAAALGVVAISFFAYAGRIPAGLASHGLDKLFHALMAGTLTVCLAWSLRGRFAVAATAVLVVLAADEYAQRFSASRSSDFGDLAADAVGVAAAVAILRRQRRPAKA